MNKNLLIYFLMLIVCSSIVLAVDYEPSTNTTILAQYSVDDVLTSANATIEIIDPSGTQTVYENMTVTGVGMFSYNHTWSATTGTYTVVVRFFDSELNLLGTSTEEVLIGLLDSINIGECPSTKSGKNTLWLIFIILCVIGIVGIFSKIPSLLYLSGAFMMFLTLVMGFCGNIVGYLNFFIGLIFLMIGFAMKTND